MRADLQNWNASKGTPLYSLHLCGKTPEAFSSVCCFIAMLFVSVRLHLHAHHSSIRVEGSF